MAFSTPRSHLWMLLLPLAASLSCCAPAAPNRDEAGRPSAAPPVYVFRGRGRPGHGTDWRGVIRDGRILLDSPTSAGWAAMPQPQPRVEGGRRTFAGERLTLVIDEAACTISDYRRALADRVTIEWDAGRFEGCGGPRTMSPQMAGTVWELIRIGDAPAPSGRSPAVTLIFGPRGSIGGTLACNDGGVRATWTSTGRIVHGEPGFESTAVGCSDPAAEAFGMRFWGAMVTAKAWRRQGEWLRITFADDSEAELRLLL